MDKIEEILTRGVANIVPGKEELRKLLQSDKKLNIYLGIDPTSTKIHLGHAVVLRKLQQFADQGHHVTFLIGDFTALIGDTSDKDSERPVLTSGEIENNFQTYKKQAEKIVDFSKVKVRRNSEWLKKLGFEETIKLCSHFSVGDFTSRELIRKRLNDGKRVGLQEFLYPVMQGYDSYQLKTDIQIGGTDQTFNIQAGRTLIKALENRESFVLTTMLLEGTDGRKMSKSWGNAIWLEDAPEDVYAKVMAINDDLIIKYYTLATNVPFEEVGEAENALKKGEHPMKIKKELAFQITEELHRLKGAEKGKANFEKTVQQKKKPVDTPTKTISSGATISEVLLETSMVSSKSEAKRLIEQGGVKLDGEKINDEDFIAVSGILEVGKRRSVEIKIKK